MSKVLTVEVAEKFIKNPKSITINGRRPWAS
jgi:hypothetical protein